MKKKKSLKARAKRISKKVKLYSHKRNQKGLSGRDGSSVMGSFPKGIGWELFWPRKQDVKRYALFSEDGKQACLARKQGLHKGVSGFINLCTRGTS